MIAGVLVLVYYSRALDPPGKTVDPLQAHQAAYYNIKHGITAVCLVFLGEYLATITLGVPLGFPRSPFHICLKITRPVKAAGGPCELWHVLHVGSQASAIIF